MSQSDRRSPTLPPVRASRIGEDIDLMVDCHARPSPAMGLRFAYRVSLAPHNPQGPVSTAASLEFGFSQPSYVICEAVHADVPWRDDIVTAAHTVRKAGRLVLPHDRPGLGIELDEREVGKHPYEPEVLQRVFHPDGSVGDW